MSAANRGAKRRKADHYPTPQRLANFHVRKVCEDYLGRPPKIHVLDPSSGRGPYIKAVHNHFRGHHDLVVHSCDPFFKRPMGSDWHHNEPFEKLEVKGFDLIIGNPPYSLAQKHIEHALKMLNKGGVLSFLLRINFLGSKKRKEFWKKFPASHLYVLSERPSFFGNKGDATEYALFVWRKGHDGMTTLSVVSWPKKVRGTPVRVDKRVRRVLGLTKFKRAA